MRPRLPSWMRSRNSMPRPTYRLAIDTTRRRLASISFFLASWPWRSVRCSSRRRVGLSLRPLSVALSISAVAASPSSIALARMTSCSAVRSGTLPISLRYMRTGSLVGALRASSSSRAERASRANSSASSSSTISTTSMFSSCRCCRMLSICSAETSTGARASMTSSLVRKPRSLPLATRSRTSSICASLAIAICSGTSRSVTHAGAPASHLGGALGEIPVASGPRLPQGSPSGLEGDELFEDCSVLVRPLHRVHTLQVPLELVDDAGEAELLQPPEHLVSVPSVFLGRERLHGQAAQEAAVGLGGGRLQDRLQGLAGAAGLGQGAERGQGPGGAEPVRGPALGRLGRPVRVLEGELEGLTFDPGLGAARARRGLRLDRGPGGLSRDHGEILGLVEVESLDDVAGVSGSLHIVGNALDDRDHVLRGPAPFLRRDELVAGQVPVQPPPNQRLGLGDQLPA